MLSAAPDKIIYEHPLNEKTRTYLRLEHLFSQVEFHLPQEQIWASRAAVDALLDVIAIFSRADIKADLIKELDRQRGKLAAIQESTPGVDMQRLEQILSELETMTRQLYAISGQLGQKLRENEFLKSIMQRSSIPGGNCAFDLPHYHYWLQQSPDKRQHELNDWFESMSPVRSAVSLLLSLVRGSTRPTTEVAETGFFQRTLDPQAPAQLIRVGLHQDAALFAEISGGRHRFTVRFMEPMESERPSQTDQNVSFLLTCCIL